MSLHFLSKLKFSTRLFLGIGCILLAFIISIFAFFIKLNDISEQTSLIYNHPFVVSNAVEEIKIHINAMHRSMKDVVLAKDELQFKEALEIVNENEEKIKDEFIVIYKKYLGKKESIIDAEEAFIQWKPIRTEVINLVLKGETNKAAEITKNKGAEHVKFLLSKMDVLHEFAKKKAIEFSDETISKRQEGVQILLVFLVVLIVVSITVGVALAHSISQPIRNFFYEIKDLQELKISESGEYLRNEQKLLEIAGQRLAYAYKKLKHEMAERLEIEKELTLSEKKYRTMFNNSQFAIVMTELTTGNVIDANKKAATLLGYNTVEGLKAGYKYNNHYADPNERKIFVENLLENGKFENAEFGMLTVDGESVWIGVSAYLNKEEGWVEAFMVDLTELKKHRTQLEQLVYSRTKELNKSNEKLKAEIEISKALNDELQESRHKYKRLSEYLGNKYFSYSYDRNRIVDHISFGVEYIFEKPIFKIKNHDYTSIVNWNSDDIVKAKSISDDILSGDIKEETYKIQFETKNGSIKTLEIYATAAKDKENRITGVDGIGVDITEETIIKQELENSRNRLELATEGANIGMWDWNLKTGEVRYNDLWARNLGFEPSDLEPNMSTWENLICKSDKKKVIDLLYGNVNGYSGYFESEHRLKTKSGICKWVLARGKVVERDDEGEAMRHSGTYVDISKLKDVEEELRVNEEQFRRMIQKSPLPMVITDKNQDIEFFNDKFTELFGYTLEDVSTAEKWWQIAYPDIAYRERVQQSWINAIELAIKNNTDIEKQVWELTIKDRSNRTCEFYMVPFEGFSLIIMNDITEQQKFELELSISKEKAEEKTKELRERIKELQGIYSFSLLLEKENNIDVICKELVDNIIPKSLQFPSKVYAIIQIEGQEYCNIENYQLEESKQRLRAEITCYQEQVGEIIIAYTENLPFIEIYEQNLIDNYADKISIVIEKMKSQQALYKSEIELKKVVKDLTEAQAAAKIGSWKWFVKEDRVEWSDEMYSIFGVNKDGFNGDLSEIINKCVHPEDRKRLEEVNKSVIEQKKPIPVEYRIVLEGNIEEVVWAEAGEFVLDTQGDVEHLSGVVQDITNRKKAEKELIKAKEDAEESKIELENTLNELKNTQEQLINSEKMASIGILSAGIAHEIYNPINYISGGMAGLMKKQKNLIDIVRKYQELGITNLSEDSEQAKAMIDNQEIETIIQKAQKMMQNIQTGIDQTINIINSLKVFTSENDIYSNVNIIELIENVLVVLYNEYKNRIDIIKQFEEIPDIPCSSGKISQVIMNLVINAIQAIEDKGTITVATENLVKYVSIKISDTGCGIPSNLKNKIYDPFYTNRKVGKGTGLGLYLVYTIIKQHKGRISFTSKDGKGTTFKVLLPKQGVDKIA